MAEVWGWLCLHALLLEESGSPNSTLGRWSQDQLGASLAHDQKAVYLPVRSVGLAERCLDV